MKILFLSLLDFDSIKQHNIYTDLLREFVKHKHELYIISPVERKLKKRTFIVHENMCTILKLKIGNIQKTNYIEKGISTLFLEKQLIYGIKKYFSNVKFDLVLYATPPVTFQKVIEYVKKRDDAKTYLMLKDIWPQGLVDLNVIRKNGLLYSYFRRKEKRLYSISDYIGCMSEANICYVKKCNPEIEVKKIKLCPNCIEPLNRTITTEERCAIRKELGISENALLFVYGGNLGKAQGIPFLIECLRSVQRDEDIFFLIAGSGTEYFSLNDYINTEHPKNVKLLEYMPKEKYERMILAADVGMVFLDYRFTIPNFPSRILSYMDAGLPIFAITDKCTDLGDLLEVEHCGVTVRNNCVDEFIKKVDYFKKCECIKTLGENARNCMKKYFHVESVYRLIMDNFEIKSE